MKFFRRFLFVLTALAAASPTYSVPIPSFIDWEPTGFLHFTEYWEGHLRYDATTDRLTSANAHSFEFSPTNGNTSAFEGTWLLQTAVDEHFHIIDPGSVTLLGDVGNGLELLITGAVRRVTFWGNYTELDHESSFIGAEFMQIAFEIDFLHDLLRSVFNRYAGFHVGIQVGDHLDIPFAAPGSYPSPLTQDFDCSIEFRCQQIEGSYGLNPLARIPEPGVLAMTAAGILLLLLQRIGVWARFRKT